MEENRGGKDTRPQEEEGGGDVCAVRIPHGDYARRVKPVLPGGRGDEIRELRGPLPEVFEIEDALREASEKPRHPALEYLASRAETRGAGRQVLPELEQVLLVSAGPVEEEQRRQALGLRGEKSMNELGLHGYSVAIKRACRRIGALPRIAFSSPNRYTESR